MSGGVVCYIERTPGGTGIRRIRLIAAGLARQWSAPDPSAVSSVGGADGGGHSPLAVARAGATWIAETLNQVGLKRLAALCVDSEGSICAWLSAPSAEPSVVRATIEQSGAETDGTGGSGAGVGAARLLNESGPGGSGGLMVDTSVQALATLEPMQNGRGLALPWKKKGEPEPTHRKHRYAVLAVQDGIARVLLDELDARGIETERVVTLWHAMAGAWDKAEAASAGDRLVSAGSPSGAVILVEPAGRLIWAWTRAGELVAGGMMRLATRARREVPADAGGGEALSTSDAARRAPQEADDGNLAIDFTPADAGRLAVDWLSWSAQLGHCPTRVVCLAVPSLGGGVGDATGPEALFANLARVWPGATIDGAVHEDPIGASVGRLAGLGPEVRVSLSGEKSVPAEERPYHERPREAMAELSARPGKADRRLHQWIGVALCGAAALVGAIGWQFNRSMGAATAELAAARRARIDALNAAAVYGANIPKSLKYLEELAAALKKVQDQNKAIKPARPVLSETVRLLSALHDVEVAPPPPPSAPAAAAKAGDEDEPPAADAGKAEGADGATPAVPGSGENMAPGSIPVPGAPVIAPSPMAATRVILNELDVGPFAATAKFIVPDATTGPTIVEKVQARPGVLQWSGSTGVSVGAARTYTLTGIWPEDNRVTGPAPAPSPPTTTPASPAKRPAAAVPAPAPAPVSAPAPAPASPTTPNPTSAKPVVAPSQAPVAVPHVEVPGERSSPPAGNIGGKGRTEKPTEKKP